MDDETISTTPDEHEAWLRAKVDEFGLTGWRRQLAFSREGDSFSLEMNFFKQLCETVPAFEERRKQRAREIWEKIATHEVERLRNVEYALSQFKVRIAELSIVQANDSAFEGDTLLATHIANLVEGCRALIERVEQLKGTKVAKYSPAKAPSLVTTLEYLGVCFKALSADLRTDEALRGHDLHGDLIKLLHEWGAVAERAMTLKPAP